MQPTRRELLAVTASFVTLAGCSGDGGSGDGGDGGSDGGDGGGDGSSDGGDGSDGGSQDGMDGSVTVQVRDHPDLGEILVDSEGMALYMFDSDEQGSGASTCTGGCLDNWPALTVDGDPATGDSVDAELTTFERDDGSTQVSANGWPLYYYIGDESPGDVAGQGLNDVWWVLRPDGTPVRGDGGTDSGQSANVQVRSHSEHGDILVDSEGMTLYMFDSDERGSAASACSGGCAENWPPLTTDGDPVTGDGVMAELTTFERGDGSTQIAANGWPLYYFANDEQPGDATGQGANDVWWVLDPSGSPKQAQSSGPY